MRQGSASGPPELVPNRGPVDARQPSRDEIRGTKGSLAYRTHSYHTKVPVEGLVGLIEHYTSPGDVVVDPFCGSGMTGLAAVLSGRHAVISDLSPAAVHISRNYCTPADPVLVQMAGEKVLGVLAAVERSLYGLADGTIEYTVWSDVFACPDCGDEISFWSAGVDQEAGSVRSEISCPIGHGPFAKRNLEWLRTVPVQTNVSVPGGKRRQVAEIADPGPTLEMIRRAEIPFWYPKMPFEPWREMWRGQHRAMGVATAADFYTDRNLWALGALWHEVAEIEDDRIREALRFVFTSVVNRASRRYQWHPSRPTNVLSSTMYIASLNYEFNVFSMFRRKLVTAVALYEQIWRAPGSCEVHRGSATDLSWIPDESVDYVFTDPPFGSNIFYGDSSFLWEAWLGESTDLAAEAVVNKRLPSELGGKAIGGYEALIAGAMGEIGRVLRPKAWASLMFHSTDDAVWSAIQRSVEDTGFKIEAAVVMDKGQASFKALRHEHRGERVANFDLVMHLQPGDRSPAPGPVPADTRSEVCRELREHVATAPPSKRTTPWLHSVVMRWLLANRADLEGWNFRSVEALCGELFARDGNAWALKDSGTS